ncbi:MAG: geranyl transferase [Gammaproteobacteria bacterium]|jgi:geranylgeranyl pyrophosphate synthase|nr:geranyl transferase [Gammaproteobacteria bacterium]
MKDVATSKFLKFQEHCQARLQAQLAVYLKPKNPSVLYQAMAYSVLNGGKRLRGMLVYATGEALRAPQAELDVAACAVEMIHAFSLIHDDLPAMDNDDLRRGKPTCHIAFDEATAILAGDALQTQAFQILSQNNSPQFEPVTRLKMIEALSIASGAEGMAGGQQIDVHAVGKKLNLQELQYMHHLKTGRLISASVELGYLAAGRDEADLRKALLDYAEQIGLAFQIQDDILDLTSQASTLGKTAQKDLIQNKATYPMLLGLEEAKRQAGLAYETAIASLGPLGKSADILKAIADYIVQRDR